MAVQWLRVCLPMQGVQVRSLVGELRHHIPQGQKKKTFKKKKNRNSIVNKFKKDLKNAPHQKIFKNKQTPIGTEHSIDVTFLPFPEPVSL